MPENVGKLKKNTRGKDLDVTIQTSATGPHAPDWSHISVTLRTADSWGDTSGDRYTLTMAPAAARLLRDSLDRYVDPCPACDGRGTIWSKPCSGCDGTGSSRTNSLARVH